VVSTWDELSDRLIERYGDLATRLTVYFAFADWRRDRSLLDRWSEVSRDVIARSGG
jgi:hypothetical protein